MYYIHFEKVVKLILKWHIILKLNKHSCFVIFYFVFDDLIFSPNPYPAVKHRAGVQRRPEKMIPPFKLGIKLA